MKDLKNFEAWAAVARADEPPRVDVLGVVLARLAAEAAIDEREIRLSWAWASAAALVAVPCAFAGYAAWQSILGERLAWMIGLAGWGIL